MPPSARWWVSLGPLPAIAAIWGYQASRLGGLVQLREFLGGDTVDAPDERGTPSTETHSP